MINRSDAPCRLHRSAIFAATVLACARLIAQPVGVARPGTLHLKNGDFVSGRLAAAADGKALRWHSSLFQDTLRFDVRGVARISYVTEPRDERRSGQAQTNNPLAAGFLNLLKQLPQVPSAVPINGARIELAGGQVLLGDVTALDADHLYVSSERHGPLQIRRSRVVALDGISASSSLLFDGSGSLTAWTILSPSDFQAGEWQIHDRDLVTTKIGANLYYQPPEGRRTIYEVGLAGSQHPEFQLVFGMGNSLNDVKNGFSVETWGDDLVIHRQAGGQFRHVVLKRPSLKKTNWQLSLEVYCDADARRLAVYSQGKLLGELRTEDQVKLTGRGMLIRNRGAELRVRQARIRKWVGPMQNETRGADGDVVVLTDGTWLTGDVRSFDRRQDLLQFSSDDPQSISLAKVDRIRFQSAPLPASDLGGQIEATYSDGGLVRGEYLRSDDQGIWLTTDFSEQPVLIGWQNLLEVRWPTADPPIESTVKKGLVEHAGCRLHGRVLSGEGPSALIWEPVYSDAPIAFLAERTTRVTFEPRDQRPALDRLDSELTLTNGDAIPCQVKAIDDQAVTARFAAGETADLPRLLQSPQGFSSGELGLPRFCGR